MNLLSVTTLLVTLQSVVFLEMSHSETKVEEVLQYMAPLATTYIHIKAYNSTLYIFTL